MREVSWFESEEVAQLSVEAQDRFERDGVAVFVEDVPGQGRVRRGHSPTDGRSAAVHFSLSFFAFCLFLAGCFHFL